MGQRRGDALHDEFFDLVKKHLNPGGVVTLFVQLYESNTRRGEERNRHVLRGVPERRVWGNTNNGQGYDLVLMGQVEPIKIDLDAMEAKLQTPEVRAGRAVAPRDRLQLGGGLFSTYAGQRPTSRRGWPTR